jgi:hypothetical protein
LQPIKKIMKQIFAYFTLEQRWLLTAVVIFFLIEALYWWRLFGRVALHKAHNQPLSGDHPPVSIILSARNEYDMLRSNLPLLLTQDYPTYEVIVVNDGSDDDSESLLASMRDRYPHLTIRTLERDNVFLHSKKMALGLGIKAARYDLCLFTDADCRPSGTRWLRSMQRHFTEGTELVIGYTRLANAPRWIRADHFMQALRYMGKALLHKAYMGVNSNLAYQRELFFLNKGFDVRITENMREDTVFVNRVATRTNTAVDLRPEATPISLLRYTSARWVRRRLEELRSLALCERPHYPEALEATCRVGFFAAVAASATAMATDYAVLLSLAGLVLIRLGGLTALLLRAQRRLGERQLLTMLWLWDLIFPFFYFRLLLSVVFRRRRTCF